MIAIIEFEGHYPVMYMENGHTISVESFCKRLLDEEGKTCSPDSVERAYFRNVPVAGSDEMIMVKAKGKGRGAYPVTYVDADLCKNAQ